MQRDHVHCAINTVPVETVENEAYLLKKRTKLATSKVKPLCAYLICALLRLGIGIVCYITHNAIWFCVSVCVSFCCSVNGIRLATVRNSCHFQNSWKLNSLFLWHIESIANETIIKCCTHLLIQSPIVAKQPNTIPAASTECYLIHG